MPDELPRRHLALSQPMAPAGRSEIADVVRGFALFGVFAANMLWVCRWFALTDAQWAALPTAELDRLVSLTVLVLVEYKLYTLLSILFGTGFAMQLGRSHRPGSEVVRTYVRRPSILLVMGIGHALLLCPHRRLLA